MSAPLPPIYTFTGNLLAERTLEFDAWMPGRTQRAQHTSFQVGGKGINVSRLLRRLGAPNTAICFLGGAAGLECESWLRARGLALQSFATSSPTRSGTVVRDRSQVHAETTFLGPDVPADAAAVAACADFLERLPAGGILAVSGSIPGWTSAAYAPLRAALANWSRRGHLIVDTYGPPLAELAPLPLALLKINADERRTLPPGPDGRDALDGVARWVVSDGPRAVRLRSAGQAELTLAPPPIREISPTGSGDVLLAAIVFALFALKKDLRAAVEYALPLAAANAADPGVCTFDFPSGYVDHVPDELSR